MIVLATTNHPDRIDSAIIDRPSRFDRKYHFNLPDLDERIVYLRHWQEQLASETSWSNDQVEPVAIASEGFSFAYLKELVVSSVMKWMQEGSDSFASTMTSQASILGGQMRTEVTAEAKRRETPHSPRQRR